jgi:nucleoside-diphosphate-sugar epimerase
MSTVCVTGGSGFIGSHAILQLLAAGHAVRATIRDLKREGDVRAMLARGGMAADASLAFHAADLTGDAGWADAVKGCEYVLHVASPFPARVPKNDDELIVPAREGALRALRAARDAGVRRVVLTSSFAAIGYGHPPGKTQFDESDWTIPDAPGVPAYPKSKTLAERAAWDFVEREGGGLELSVVNPTAVFGPILGPDFSTSIVLIQRLMNGAVPGLPKLRFGVVDVRDVADLHIRAMTDPAAKGERFIAVGDGFKSIREMALILKGRMGSAAARVPTRQLPDWLVRLAALWDPGVRTIATELGKRKNADHDKAARLLGWSPRPDADAIVATAESLGHFGLLKDREGRAP